MIRRIGVDLVEIERIAKAMRRPGFVARVLTPDERAICTNPARVAGRWALKEAIKKCLPGLASWHDAEILPGPDGAPIAIVRAPDFDPNTMRLHVSLSHERGMVVAMALLEVIGSSANDEATDDVRPS